MCVAPHPVFDFFFRASTTPPPLSPQLTAAFVLVKHVLPEALLAAFLERGQGRGPGVPGFEHYIAVAVIPVTVKGTEGSMGCFLCRGKSPWPWVVSLGAPRVEVVLPPSVTSPVCKAQ